MAGCSLRLSHANGDMRNDDVFILGVFFILVCGVCGGYLLVVFPLSCFGRNESSGPSSAIALLFYLLRKGNIDTYHVTGKRNAQ